MATKALAVPVFDLCDNQQTKCLWKHVWLTFGESIQKDLTIKKIRVVMEHASSDPIAICNLTSVTEEMRTCIRQTFTELIKEKNLQIRHVLYLSNEELDEISKQFSVQDVGIYNNKDCNNSIWIVGPSLIIGRVLQSFEDNFDSSKLTTNGESNCLDIKAEIKFYVDLSEKDLAIIWIHDLFKLECFTNGKIELDPHNCGFKISVPDIITKILIKNEIRSMIASKNLTVTMKNHVSKSLYHMFLLEAEFQKSKSKVKQDLRKHNCIWFKHNPNTITLYAENHHILEMAGCVIKKALTNDIVKENGCITSMDVFIPSRKLKICKMLLKDRKSSIESKYSVIIYDNSSTSKWFNLWTVQGEFSLVHAACFELLKIKEAIAKEKTYLINKPLDYLRFQVKRVADKRSCCFNVTCTSSSGLSTQRNTENHVDLRTEVKCRSLTVNNGFTVKLYKCSLSQNPLLGHNTLIVNVVVRSGTSDNSRSIKFEKNLSRPDQTTLFLPNWEKANEKHYLQKLMSEMKDQSVLLPVSIDLSDVAKLNWPIIKFLGAMLLAFTFNRPTHFQCFVPSEDILEKSTTIVNKWSQLRKGSLKPELQIKVVKGELSAMHCDVLVNTTNYKLELTSGKVSSALLTAAGNLMQNECDRKLIGRKHLTFSEVVVTRGYNLPAQQVFHGVIPGYKNDNFKHYEAFVKNCLKKAVELDMISIAFPAIGTGTLRYPPNIAASKMFQAVEEVAATSNLKYLREVNFVIFPTDEHVLQAFKAEEQSRKTSVTIDSVPPAPTLKLFDDSLVASSNFTTCIIEIVGLTDEIVQETFKQIEEVLKGSGKKPEENQRDGLHASKSSHKQRGQDTEGEILYLQHIWNTIANSNSDTFTSRKDVSHLSNTFPFKERPPDVSFLDYMQERPHIIHKTKDERVIKDSSKIIFEPNEDSLIQKKIYTFNEQKGQLITQKNTNVSRNPNKDLTIAETSTILQTRKEESITQEMSKPYPKLNADLITQDVPKISCNRKEEKKIQEKYNVPSPPNYDAILEARPKTHYKQIVASKIDDYSKFIDRPKIGSIMQDRTNILHKPKKIYSFYEQKGQFITQKNTNVSRNPNKDLTIAETSTILQTRKGESITQETSKPYPKLNADLITQEVPKISCNRNEEKKIQEKYKVPIPPNYDAIFEVRPKTHYKPKEASIFDDNSKFIDRPEIGSIMQDSTNILHKPKEDSISLITKEGIKVFVYKANICYLNNIDCIVNVSNSQMNEKSGSANVILEAGDTTKKECLQYIKDHGQLGEKCICSTTSGNLFHYKKIFHVNCNALIWYPSCDIKKTSDILSAVITICLTQANTDNMSSIALPLIIPLGLYTVWKRSFVGTYPESVMKFSEEVGKKLKVKEIHFVDTDQALVDCLQVTFLQTISDSHQSKKGNDSGIGIGLSDLKRFHSLNTYKNTMKSMLSELNEERIDKPVKCQSLRESDRDMNVPSNWTQMDAKEMITTVVLQPNDQEYKDVVDKFKHGSSVKCDIVRVVRIQNKTLYMQYVARKTLMDSINPTGCQNERMLWHGTASEAVDGINTYGFNRSYSGKNAALYGNGVYFAEYPSYSSNKQYAKPDQSSNKRVYLCKVLVGEYVKGERSMRVPPQKPGASGSHILYDSVVDNQSTPKIFVIFHDTQAYPDYLIVFK